MRRWLYIIIPAAILVGLVVWRFTQNKRAEAAQAQAANARKHAAPIVVVAPAVVRDIVHTFQGVGDVEAPQDVRVSAKITGRLIFLEVREGAPVTRGQVLARIDPIEVQASINQQQAVVESAQANLANAQVKYNRTYSLYKQGFIAAQDLDDARTQVNVQKSAVNAAQAQLRNLRAQYGDTVLRSPLTGFVTARFFDPGSVVTAGQPIVGVQAIRRVFVSTSVPEGMQQDIRTGIPARVEFDAIPGRTFTGRVSQVNPAADPLSRQFLVRAVLDNSQNLIKPGMFCRISLVTRVTRGAVVVPREAVNDSPKGKAVVVVDDRLIAHRRPVDTGDEDTVGIQIVRGLQPGERVVTLSAQPVRDAQKVQIDTGGRGGRGGRQVAGQPTVSGGGGGAPMGPPPGGGGPPAPTYGAGAGSAGGSGGGALGSGSTLGGSGSAGGTGLGNGGVTTGLGGGFGSGAGTTGGGSAAGSARSAGGGRNAFPGTPPGQTGTVPPVPGQSGAGTTTLPGGSAAGVAGSFNGTGGGGAAGGRGGAAGAATGGRGGAGGATGGGR